MMAGPFPKAHLAMHSAKLVRSSPAKFN